MQGLVDIVILTYRPDDRFFDQVAILQEQSIRPGKIIIMNTEEKYLQTLLYGTRFLEENPNVEIHNISKREFDHGKTRNQAAKYSSSVFLIYMTLDALPIDHDLIAGLLRPMKDPDVAVSYARQIPDVSANPIERYNRLFNYPDKDRIQTAAALPELGIKTFFCSDVCACYRKKVFCKLGGFVPYAIFNEDMIFASNAIRDGKTIYYASEAKVIHSHNYTASQQFHRNFDLGVSHADHPEVFGSVSDGSEGKKLVLGCIRHLLSKGRFYLIPRFMLHCAARYRGYSLGKRYRSLKKKRILKCTQNPGYWERYWDRTDVPGSLKNK